MSKETQAFDLVLEIVRNQQDLLEKLLVEIHGSEGPGLKGAVTELRSKLEGIEEKVTGFLQDRKDEKKTKGQWAREIITWVVTIALALGVGHWHGSTYK